MDKFCKLQQKNTKFQIPLIKVWHNIKNIKHKVILAEKLSKEHANHGTNGQLPFVNKALPKNCEFNID